MDISDQAKATLLRLLPGLSSSEWRVTSEMAAIYNCFAWAAGESHRTWDTAGAYYWPPGVERIDSIAAYVEAYRAHGFEVCDGDELEAGFEKIALYADGTEPTHAARQLPDGAWTSKLGFLEDITHRSVRALEGSEYGRVALVMKRRAG